MRYAEYRSRGLPIGSGRVEAACKTVMGRRMKCTGMRWTVAGANPALWVRCARLGGWFDDYWEHRHRQAARDVGDHSPKICRTPSALRRQPREGRDLHSRSRFERDGSKFVVFVPSVDGAGAIGNGLVVKAEEVGFNVDDDGELYNPLMQAAIHHIKVTALVSYRHRRLTLEQVVVPAIPTK